MTLGPRPRPLGERLWARVNKTPTCWMWTGLRTPAGYGQIALDGGRGARKVFVHRLVYELTYGRIPSGRVIDHACRVRLCCNPEHLQAVSNGENLQNQSGPYKTTQTGVRGVSFDRRRNTFRAYASADGIRHEGGRFKTLAEAEKAAIALRLTFQTNNLLDRQTGQVEKR